MKKGLFDTLCQDRTLFNAWKAVREKGASGGIDGISINLFEEELDKNICELKEELISRKWNPDPYLKISIPKKENEKRILGLLCIKDKIVQQAIKQIIENRFEKIFVSNSYGYRPGKGHGKAVKFTKHCCQNRLYPYILRLDIDNYFDTINHDILFKRLQPLINDSEILRLIQLCIKMGMVDKRLNWEEITEGVPQGAILSPLLANFYLHPFDQFVLSRTKMYVRYADDFIIFCKNREETDKYKSECSEFLENRLKLSLNEPSISETKTGIEFLGVFINDKDISLSSEKEQKLISKIDNIVWDKRNFTKDSLEGLKHIHNYYEPLLSQEYLNKLDTILLNRLKKIIHEEKDKIPNKSTLLSALKEISFFSLDNKLKASDIRSDIINEYLNVLSEKIDTENKIKNKRLILSRKKEYRQKENETRELIINTYGTYIGINEKGITVKVHGQKQSISSSANLQHITILCDGVSISSNAISFCMQNNIGIDYFNNFGKHIGSIMSMRYIHTSLWTKQANMSQSCKCMLAISIIIGKIRNQMNLVKYFHKYHKDSSETLIIKHNEIIPAFKSTITELKNLARHNDYQTRLIYLEAKCAELYWGYIKELIKDDDVIFTNRERHGAKDLVNSMLNYGYSILYPRIWQAVLRNKLNPTISVIHAPQAGKPTFVYDIIELFRAQAVDRVVISLIQKKEPLKIKDGLIDKDSKKLLVQNLLERMNRYEKYRDKDYRLCDIINTQVREIAEYIDNGTKFKPYIAKW